jgi:hypothetical protein
MSHQHDRPAGEKRRRNSVAPNPWRRGRRRPQAHDARPANHGVFGPTAGHRQPLVAALFADARHAERAHALLFGRGYRHDEIVVAMAESKWKGLFGTGEAPPDTVDTPAHNGGAATVSAGQPVPFAIGSDASTTRVMAAGELAALFVHAEPSRGEDAFERALVDCGMPPRNASACASGVEAGKILLAVTPHSDAEAELLREEWSRASGDVPGV